MGLQATHSSDQLQRSANGSLGVVLVGLGVAEVDQHPVPHVLRDEAAEALHSLGDTLLVGGNDFAQVFRVHTRRQRCRADQVGEHHCDLAALGAVFGRGVWGTRRSRCVNGSRLAVRVAAQRNDGIQQLHTVSKRRDAKLLQVLVRQLISLVERTGPLAGGASLSR